MQRNSLRHMNIPMMPDGDMVDSLGGAEIDRDLARSGHFAIPILSAASKCEPVWPRRVRAQPIYNLPRIRTAAPAAVGFHRVWKSAAENIECIIQARRGIRGFKSIGTVAGRQIQSRSEGVRGDTADRAGIPINRNSIRKEIRGHQIGLAVSI